MALIKCPECGKEISDKSSACIHCGFPLKKQDHISYKNVVLLTPHNGYSVAKQNIPLDEAIAFKKDREKFGFDYVILDSDIDIDEYYKNYSSTLRCPKCGSTSITTGARGVNWTLGLIDAGKTVNRCGSCGYTWNPGK